MKLCTKCRYYNSTGLMPFDCSHPDNIETSPVDGKVRGKLMAEQLRRDESKCSPEGKWFEAKADGE